MKRIALTLLAAISLSAVAAKPDKFIELNREFIRARLVDPDSAKFFDEGKYVGEDGKTVSYCGFVNSKNQMGGFTGKQPIIITGDGLFITDGRVWSVWCQRKA